MSEVCCDLCAYWLPQLKECGNTHINKCTNKEHFVKVERNCGTCEREIRAEAIDGFAEALKEEYVFDSICRDDVSKYEYENKIDRIVKQMKEGI